jgi:hypothetical protein
LTTDETPTVAGFEWSWAPAYVPMEPGEDGWCVRNALCELFEWEADSPERSRFREGVAGRDVSRLAEHLGLTEFQLPRDWDGLISRSAHPGIAWFIFEADRKAHTVYVPDVRVLLYHWGTPDGLPSRETNEYRLLSFGWPLGYQYIVRRPELGAVLVDERQPPRPV